MRIMPLTAAAALALGAAACTSYTPITVASAPAGATVRVTLNDAALLHSYGSLGSRVRTFSGKVRSANSDSLTLAVTDIERVDATREERTGDVVSVASRRHYVGRAAAHVDRTQRPRCGSHRWRLDLHRYSDQGQPGKSQNGRGAAGGQLTPSAVARAGVISSRGWQPRARSRCARSRPRDR